MNVYTYVQVCNKCAGVRWGELPDVLHREPPLVLERVHELSKLGGHESVFGRHEHPWKGTVVEKLRADLSWVHLAWEGIEVGSKLSRQGGLHLMVTQAHTYTPSS